MIPIKYSPEFERWWKLYPRKDHKQDAARAFKTTLMIRTVDFLCRVTVVYKTCTNQWPRDQRRFIPLPATWLNKGGYDADPSVWREKIPKDDMTPTKIYRPEPPPLPLTDKERDEEKVMFAEFWEKVRR